MGIKFFRILIGVLALLANNLGLTPLSAAHFESPVAVTIKVEDMSYQLRVKALSFNGEEIALDEPDFFRPRKVVCYKLQPGKYVLNWTSQKGGGKWADKENKHERILVIEGGDTEVRIHIKGDSITLY
jgi:hypothetical protein